MLISGCIPFTNRKERRKLYYELKQEFGSTINIIIENNFITYSCKVDRNFI